MQELKKRKVHQFTEYKSGHQSCADPDHRRDKRLCKKHPGNMALPHAKDVVNTDLPFSPFNQETVRVKQKDYRKNDDHASGIAQDQFQVVFHYTVISCQRIHDVEHHDRKDCRENIRDIRLMVILQICDRKSGIDRSIHYSSPPASSTVSVSEIF